MTDDIALDQIRQAGSRSPPLCNVMSEMVSNWTEGAGP